MTAHSSATPHRRTYEEQVHFMNRQAQMLAEEGNDVSSRVMQEALAMLAIMRGEVEQFQTQLGGCSVAALGWNKEPAKKGDYGWSVAYQDVLDLRAKYERLQADHAAALSARSERATPTMADVIAWADGVSGALGTEYASRVTESEAKIADAILKIAAPQVSSRTQMPGEKSAPGQRPAVAAPLSASTPKEGETPRTDALQQRAGTFTEAGMHRALVNLASQLERELFNMTEAMREWRDKAIEAPRSSSAAPLPPLEEMGDINGALKNVLLLQAQYARKAEGVTRQMRDVACESLEHEIQRYVKARIASVPSATAVPENIANIVRNIDKLESDGNGWSPEHHPEAANGAEKKFRDMLAVNWTAIRRIIPVDRTSAGT